MWQLLPGIEQAAFICGCGHSGTTLLATILSVHPQLYVPLRETHAFLVQPSEMALRLAAVAQEANAERKHRVVEKTPRHIRRLQVIRQVVPGARFIILVRDGRDVVASLANRFKGNFDYGLERWTFDTDVALRQRGRPDAIVIRYEDLVADTASTVAKVCGFLGVPYLDSLLDYYKTPHLWYAKTSIEETDGVGDNHKDLRNWQVNQPVFDGRAKRRGALPPEILVRLGQGRASEIMRAFGYADATATTKAGSLKG